MCSIYGGLTVYRVKVNDYLVMGLDLKNQETVKVSIIKYLHSVLQDLPYQLGVTVTTPDAGHIFQVID